MSFSINTVTISGNLCRDVELRATPSGMSVANFSMAYNGRVKVGDEWQDKAHFFDVVVWGAIGEQAAKGLSKGSKVVVSGRLEQRSWEKDGTKHSKVEINAVDLVYDNRGQAKSQDSANDFDGDDIRF